MKPGRELDALVAEHVMGLTPRWLVRAGNMDNQILANIPDREKAEALAKQWGVSGYVEQCNYPRYSDDIRDAWEVVEKVWGTQWFRLERFKSENSGETFWYAGKVLFFLASFGGDFDIDPDTQGKAPTPAHAICLAALRTKGIEG